MEPVHRVMAGQLPRRARYAVLEPGGSLPGMAFAGISDADGSAFQLIRVPAVSPTWTTPAREVPRSGICLDDDCHLYLSHTEANRIVRIALDCPEQLVFPGADTPVAGLSQLHQPAGICQGPLEMLIVADPGGAQLLIFTRDLNLRGFWRAGLSRPVGVAADGDVAVLVLDAGTKKVLRFDPWGYPDNAFNQELATQLGAVDPLAIAVDAAGILYTSGRSTTGIQRFGRSGRSAGDVIAPQMHAGALAVTNGMLFAADVDAGHIACFRLPDGRWAGAVAGFSGTVAALAASRDGRLFIKPDATDRYLVAVPGGAYLATGQIVAGPLDAGEASDWARLAVRAIMPDDTTVSLETCVTDQLPASAPVFTPCALDALLPAGRYLYFRLTLTTTEVMRSPRILRMQAETTGDAYVDYLPDVYSRDPGGADLLNKVVALGQAELDDLDQVLTGLPRLFDADAAPLSLLPWLASWQAFDLPPTLVEAGDATAIRTLLHRVPDLYRRRGTPRGIQDLVEIYAGARPTLFEAFRFGGIWTLDESSALGFDTVLPAQSADGLVVGQAVVGATSLEPTGSWATTLFDDVAFRFTVAVTGALTADQRSWVRRIIEREKPAHTDYHLCFVEPSLRVGIQARVGIDAVVAGPPPPLLLGERSTLDLDARLDNIQPAEGAGRTTRIGIGTTLT